jgi:kynurenine formamidase
MRRWLQCVLALAGGMLVNLALELHGSAPIPAARGAENAAEPTLENLSAGKLRIVDLSWPLNPRSAFWPGENYKPFELHTIATLEKDGVLSKAFSSPEHLGTHLDAPNHFEPGQPSVDQIPAEQLFTPGVVIDVRGPVSADPDYRVGLDDIRRFEATHGQIPSGAVVLALTGWSQFWDNPTRYQNKDVMSRLHFPGYSAEAVQFLIEQRQVRGVGLDTMSVDYGLSRDFVVHHLLGKAGRYGLENLANLDKLPPRGFTLFIAPMKIETGSGGPTRAFAVLP